MNSILLLILTHSVVNSITLKVYLGILFLKRTIKHCYNKELINHCIPLTGRINAVQCTYQISSS